MSCHKTLRKSSLLLSSLYFPSLPIHQSLRISSSVRSFNTTVEVQSWSFKWRTQCKICCTVFFRLSQTGKVSQCPCLPLTPWPLEPLLITVCYVPCTAVTIRISQVLGFWLVFVCAPILTVAPVHPSLVTILSLAPPHPQAPCVFTSLLWILSL